MFAFQLDDRLGPRNDGGVSMTLLKEGVSLAPDCLGYNDDLYKVLSFKYDRTP